MEPDYPKLIKEKQLRIWKNSAWHAAVEMAKIQRRNIDSQETMDWLFATAKRYEPSRAE